jgi:regulatory protein
LTIYLKQLQHYCAYQERCHKEVRQKLYEVGCSGTLLEEVISDLIREDYLNEERYAYQFTSGKFRMLKWGRVKITQALKANAVSAYCIKKGLTAIDESEYNQIAKNLFEKKWASLKAERSPNAKKAKARNYMLSKGYENKLVMGYINAEK